MQARLIYMGWQNLNPLGCHDDSGCSGCTRLFLPPAKTATSRRIVSPSTRTSRLRLWEKPRLAGSIQRQLPLSSPPSTYGPFRRPASSLFSPSFPASPTVSRRIRSLAHARPVLVGVQCRSPLFCPSSPPFSFSALARPTLIGLGGVACGKLGGRTPLALGLLTTATSSVSEYLHKCGQYSTYTVPERTSACG